jgi:hypothetical protein
MIAVPLVTEKQIEDALTEIGFRKTQFITETSSVWIHIEKKRHLTVPKSSDGFYPSWMLHTLAEQAKALGDDALVDAIQSVTGWQRLVPTKGKGKPRAKRDPKT